MTQSAPLILTSAVIADLADLRSRAAASPIDIATLADRLAKPAGKGQHMRQMTSQTVIIPGPFAFVVTFSIETGHPCGVVRHMSMSVDREGRVPSPAAVWMIAQHLGFAGSLEFCMVKKEPLTDGHIAVAIIQELTVMPFGGQQNDVLRQSN